MNPIKARDYFSAYRDGELEPGLREKFERLMNSDAQVQAEYRAFARSLDQLEELRRVEVELPFDLHETISARLDLHLYEKRSTAKPMLSTWWRSLAFGGLATVAIIGAIVGVRGQGASQAGVLPDLSASDVELSMAGDRLELKVPASDSALVEIRLGVDGPVVQRWELEGETLRAKVDNPNEVAQIAAITISDHEPILVALPGAVRLEPAKGEGTVLDYAQAMAGTMGLPVEVAVEDTKARVSWEFADGTLDSAMASASSNSQLTVERKSNMLRLLQHSGRND